MQQRGPNPGTTYCRGAGGLFWDGEEDVCSSNGLRQAVLDGGAVKRVAGGAIQRANL